MKNILFIHQNFPGQFRHIAEYLAMLPGCNVRAIGRQKCPGLKNIQLYRYQLPQEAIRPAHPFARAFEEGTASGHAVLQILIDLKAGGYAPDVVIAHPGWGESLYVKTVYPTAKLIHFCEFYYHAKGLDAGFDPEFPTNIFKDAEIESRNALHLLALEKCDYGVTPTKWQHSLFPKSYREKIRVIHEGINTDIIRAAVASPIRINNEVVLTPGSPILTYVARNLEPYRGFHQFMRALPKIQAQNLDCHTLIIGGDDVSYGSRPKDYQTWKAKLLTENRIDTDRVHFLGKIPYADYLKVLKISSVHLYMTYPFVLSWSVLEALAAGCLVVASDTGPVKEVISHGHNGLLVPFFDTDVLSETVSLALTMGDEALILRRQSVEKAKFYDKALGIKGYLDLVNLCL